MNQSLDYARERLYQARDIFDEVLEYSMSMARGLTAFDWIMIKLSLVSLGLLVGSMFSKFFKKLRIILIIVTAVSSLYVVWKILAPLYESVFGE